MLSLEARCSFEDFPQLRSALDVGEQFVHRLWSVLETWALANEFSRDFVREREFHRLRLGWDP